MFWSSACTKTWAIPSRSPPPSDNATSLWSRNPSYTRAGEEPVEKVTNTNTTVDTLNGMYKRAKNADDAAQQEQVENDPGIFGKGGLLSLPNIPLLLFMTVIYSVRSRLKTSNVCL